MGETVTSKYLSLYWLRLLVFVILVVIRVYLFVNALLYDHSAMRGQNLIIIGVLSVLFIVFFKMIFLRGVPKKIVVRDKNILIHELRIPNPRRIVISYADIKSTRTFKQQGDTGADGRVIVWPMQTLQIELKNGKTYDISENDFANYKEIKQAIYDRVLRPQTIN